MLAMLIIFGAVLLLCVALPAASTITATITGGISVTEQLGSTADPFVSASAKSTTTNGLSQSESLNASSTPPAALQGFDELALTAGAGTIDFRALPGLAGSIGDGNGMKVQAILLFNPATNANNMVISVGASNGYDLLGASMNITLKPGQWILAFLDDGAPDVSAGDRTIDIAGTGSQVLKYHVVLG